MANTTSAKPSCHALMQFAGEHLDPTAISQLLDLQPSYSNKKGDVLGNRNGYSTARARKGVWSFSTKDFDSESINQHIRYLLEKTLSTRMNVKSFVDKNNLSWRIVCFLNDPKIDLKSILDIDILEMIEELDIELIVNDDRSVIIVEEK